MTDKKTAPEETNVQETLFEAILSYVPIERVCVRLPASDIEVAKERILSKKNDQIRDMMIEEIKEVTELTPTPPGYMSIADLKAMYEEAGMEVDDDDEAVTVN